MSTAPATTAAPASLARRVVKSALTVGVLVLPAVLVGVLWHPQAAIPVIFGALLGLVSVAPTSRRALGLGVVALLLLLTPLAIVAGSVPLTGACLMALLCASSGITALWGLQSTLTLVPLVMAYFVVSPFSLDGSAVDRSSTGYQLTAALLVGAGALWPVLLVPAVAKEREIPPLQPVPRVDAVVYTAGITLLCSVSTFAVLTVGAGHPGTWLIVTILAVTKLAPRLTIQRSAHRILGTLIGSAAALAVAVVVPTIGLQITAAVVALALAMAARSGPRYWVYVSFMTLAVVLLSAPDEVLATGESRLLYNALGAGVVMLAAGLVLLYQHLHTDTSATPAEA